MRVPCCYRAIRWSFWQAGHFTCELSRKLAFQDSLTCINYADREHTHPCSECHLIDFVGSEHFSDEVPCHFIALNEAGETIEDLEAQDNQAKLEATLKQWMRTTIKQIEDRRAVAARTPIAA